MDKFKKEIDELLNTFAKSQIGIPLSQFAMIGLKGAILTVVDKFEKRSEKNKKGD